MIRGLYVLDLSDIRTLMVGMKGAHAMKQDIQGSNIREPVPACLHQGKEGSSCIGANESGLETENIPYVDRFTTKAQQKSKNLKHHAEFTYITG